MGKILTAIQLLTQSRRTFCDAIWSILNINGMLCWISDHAFLSISYWLKFGRRIDWSSPQTFTEKLQWLKMYDRRSEYITMVNKIDVKKYVSERIGEKYIIPTLGVWNKPKEIDWDSLPNQFVLKWNHDSGSIVICKDKSTLDLDAVIRRLKYGERINGFWYGREWPYKGVKPKLLAEKFMEDMSGELKDYKWFCFNGEPRIMFVASDRQRNDVETKFDFYDSEFNRLSIVNGHPNTDVSVLIKKPQSFELMKELAKKLSKGIPHVRVDFYDIDGHLYFGEFTFFHFSGFVPFEPIEWDYKLGQWLELPNNKNYE